MFIDSTITLTCPYCGKRGESRIDKTYDSYDKKEHTSILCPFCHRFTEMVEVDYDTLFNSKGE